VDSLSSQCLADGQDWRALAGALRPIHEFEEGTTIGPFGRPGWIKALFSWVPHEVDAYGLRLSGEFRQLNASPTFALLRLATTVQRCGSRLSANPTCASFQYPSPCRDSSLASYPV